MPKTHTVTINGFPLLASAPVIWSLRPGTRPTIIEYDIQADKFDGFLKSLGNNNIVTLMIKTADNETIEIKNLYCLGNSVGPNPYIKKIVLADRRWFWDRHAIYRKYNIRRHIGVKRLTAIDVQELQATVPEIIYARYSVKDTEYLRKWTAQEILEDIIKELVNYEKAFNKSALGYSIRGTLGKDIPVENLMIDDPGTTALNKALSFIAGAEIYIDNDGKVIIYDKSSVTEQQAEDKILDNLHKTTPMMANFGNIEKIDKSFLRPKEVRVLFHREIEVRFDANEGEYAPDFNARYMENVLSLPDWQLQDRVQGTWINIPSVLALWNTEFENRKGIAEFTLAYLRKAFVPFIDFWSPFLLNGVLIPDRDWASRVASIMMHWRRTFRINSQWMDRISNLKAYRVATIDITTGQRAPAIAYANYCQVFTERSFYFDIAENLPPSYISNFPVGLNSDKTPIAFTNKPAPVNVSVLDEDQGIIHLDFLADVYRLRENIIPGLIDKLITTCISRAKVSNVVFDAIGRNGNIPEITDGTLSNPHNTTIIMTAISAAPNDNRQYQVVVVKPSDLKSLPVGMEAKGPPIEIIIGSSIETARIRWLDSKSATIEKLFGIGLSIPSKTDEEIQLSEEVKDLIINSDSNISAGSLEEIAKAIAYRVYLPLCDRIAGSAAIKFNKDLTIQGYLDEISHEVNPDGVILTRISSPTEVPKLDLFGLLDNNTRAVIMKLAQVGK